MNTSIYLPSTEMLIYVVTKSSDSFHLVVHRDLLSGFRNVFCNDFPFRYCTSHLFANQILAIHNLFKQLEWISRPWSEDPLWLWPRLVLEMISKFGWTTRKYIVSKPSAEITDVRTVVRKLRALTVRLWWWIGYGVTVFGGAYWIWGRTPHPQIQPPSQLSPSPYSPDPPNSTAGTQPESSGLL